MTNELKIGLATPVDLWSMSIEAKHRMLEEAWAAGVNHIFMADHVSFRDGSGTDGFVEIAALSQLHAEMNIMISIFGIIFRPFSKFMYYSNAIKRLFMARTNNEQLFQEPKKGRQTSTTEEQMTYYLDPKNFPRHLDD